MNQKKRSTSTRLPAVQLEQAHPRLIPCDCQPLSLLHKDLLTEPKEQSVDWSQYEQIVPVTPILHSKLRNTLNSLLPSSTATSVFLLHISQWENTHLTPQTALPSQRHRYHAPIELLEQIILNMRRVMRIGDHTLVQEPAGLAIILPDVDQQGAYHILERVYHSVSLLQAGTIVPPLVLDTTITMGIGTYPTPASSLEQLLSQASTSARCVVLRPAITTQLWDAPTLAPAETDHKSDQPTGEAQLSGIPFMRLPQQLPTRLQHLIPHHLAVELRCAPVGRDHHCLTVAMAAPTDSTKIQRLHEITGMTIFPVSCNLEELATLLEKKW